MSKEVTSITSSPTWTRPSDVMKLRQLKRRIRTPGTVSASPTSKPDVSIQKSQEDEDMTCDDEDIPSKRRKKNPFSVSPRKRLNMGNSSAKDSILAGLGANKQASTTPDRLANRRFAKELTFPPSTSTNASFLDLISSISDDSQDTELFQRVAARQEKAATPAPSLPVETLGNRSVNRDAPSSQAGESANSSLNFSSLNLSSSSFVNSSENQAAASNNKILTSSSFPADWSLKTRIRFQAEAAWPWQGTMKTLEEATGVAEFISPSSSSSQAWQAQIQSATLTWMFPSVPGLQTFPRYSSNLKNVDANPLLTQPKFVDALAQEWASSLTSAFNQLKGGRCPYFYVCAHRFTVLVRASGLAALGDINAQISPTTKGLRDGLSAEGIEFSMPLGFKKRRSNDSVLEQKMPSASGEAEVEEEEIENSAASNWLESMGIDKTKFPSLAPARVSLAQDNFRVVDGRPESLVVVEGLVNVQAFYNFLLNNNHLSIAASGSQAGVPPTILSPCVFKGATLKSLRVNHGTMRYKSSKASQILYTLDVVGPILPHQSLNLCAIATSAAAKSFSVTCTNQESSFAFNYGRDVAGRSESEVKTLASSSLLGLGTDGVHEMGLNRFREVAAIRESYFESDEKLFTSVLQ